MLTTEAPQHLRHACDPEEFEQYVDGTKTFDLKLNDGVFTLQEGDMITFEERDAETGELTGKKEIKRVGVILDTTNITNVSNEEIAKKGLSIFSLVQPTHRTLYSLYDRYFTVSVAIDRHDRQEVEEDPKWEVLGVPSTTPILACPDFVDGGVLESLNINNWPIGRYSVTMLIGMDLDQKEPPFDIQILDIIVMVIIADESNPKDFEFAELNPEVLESGISINLKTDKKVIPLHPEDVDALLSAAMTEEEAKDYPDMMSEEEMERLLADARARGEDVDIIEQAFLGNEDSKENADYEEEDEDDEQ